MRSLLGIDLIAPRAPAAERMYVAMNRFKVVKGSEEPSRTSGRTAIPASPKCRLSAIPSAARPLNEAEGYTLFASHTIWESQAISLAWTKSENFRAAHRNAGATSRSISATPCSKVSPSVDGA